MFGKSKLVGEWIARVAAAAEDPAAFTARAREAAEELGPRAIGKTKAFLLAPPDKPPELAGKLEGVGDWMWVCQAAIFEIWFYFGADAMRDLRSFAFGVYDWTQAPATQVLCRLALGGLDARATAELIAESLPDWRHEQVMRVCEDVARLAARSQILRTAYLRLIDSYRQDGDPVATFELIAALAAADPASVKERYLPFLRDLMQGRGLEGRTAFDDGHVVQTADGKGIMARGGPEYPQVADYHQIRTALLLRTLVPGDAEVVARLAGWADAHPDADVRRQLRESFRG
jgi:hypothetical protein